MSTRLVKLLLFVISVTYLARWSADAQTAPELAKFDAKAFRDGAVDNRFFPLRPGTVYVFRVREGDEVSIDSITVTSNTKQIAGVRAVVVHDRVRRNGKLTEDTYDWYAQDTAGNVWYMGEDTRAYKGRSSSRQGSWEAGLKGARAGIIMLAQPKVGVSYRQEYRKASAEDMGQVLSLHDSVTVPAGHFTGCITTKDWSPLERGVVEHKTYCPGFGVVLEQTIAGGNERSELISIRRP